MDSFHIRIRLERDIAEQAMAMANDRGLELGDVIRMMVTKAVLSGDFAIGHDRPSPPPAAETRAFFAYDDSQWAPLKSVLDAELALALLNQFVATHTVEIERLLDLDPPDVVRVEQLTRERDEARHALSTLDPQNAQAIDAIVERYASPQAPTRARTSSDQDDGETA
ncbi:MAG: hypothetical protein DI563_02205 [Variovorax paradoxus]|uniref:Uncharacterized protein n=1 Tax=Variovorax paradoxus TaxID=34073 RepID=A0A2W5QKR9_VARPD|nr:MAG: hypothetical protein DI563_02205 [Variovorax paradoxus]